MVAHAEKKMTRAQRKWLEIARSQGFVQMGGWGQGQRNRPLWALVRMGLLEVGHGPKNSFLKAEGFWPVEKDKSE